ncbi:glycine--tRNA ligase subunit beta [Novosphingobium sp. ZN18A2]|uniref:glycine--tRNA ligase subunit beta n=1 Tax=Novosphingobium sp. ZN18A2 TaxID=3079861 RepID=UPI0030CDD043
MSDFLLELRCEEIPARMQAGARADLEKLLRKEMDAAGVAVGEVAVWSTPRRLALIARDLPRATEAVSEEAKGPPADAPDQAVEGFCRKNGVTRDQLEVRDVKGRPTFFAVTEKPGRQTGDVLGEAIPAIVRAFPWPKSMRWGAASLSTESLRWVRPLSGIVALLDQDVVECEVGGIASGQVTRGHRFHYSGDVVIDGAHDYADKLRQAHVIVDHAEREALIRDRAREVASEAGLTLVEDEGLVIENAGLTEWPVPMLGRFEEDFLEVPPEVIQLTARVNQKYFVCEDKQGKLANAFVCTANIDAIDGGTAIVDGNRKVLAARLSDARFFWDQDRKVPLAEQAKKLERITFHEKLGTVADKVERVAKLARWLVESDIVVPAKAGTAAGSAQPTAMPASAGMTKEQLADMAEQAARLCKADLVTEMVGEFPELQGLMGGYYARAEGLPGEVADAIRDHYKPVGQGDEVPTAPVTVAVSLADKLDTLAGFFYGEMPPSGSKDPFALRRAAIGFLSVIQSNDIRLPLLLAGLFAASNVGFREQISPLARIWPTVDSIAKLRTALGWREMFDPLIEAATKQSNEQASLIMIRSKAATMDLLDFFADRLKVQQREAGVRHDLIDAVFALGGEDDLVRLLARVHALQAFIGTEDGTNLLAGYKRAANILKKEDYPSSTVTPAEAGVSGGGASPAAMPASAGMTNPLSYTPEPAEKALMDALDTAEPRADAAVAAEDFTAAMEALASLRAPIDAFFDSVTVNDADEEKRAARLALLDRFRAAVHKVADFSRIEG